jgi:hypothetical protein
MPDALRRALRTFVQAFLGSIITSGILSTTETVGVVDWSALKKVAVSAVAAAVIALITWAQNYLEDTTTVPALLKAPPSGGVNPVPDEAGHTDVTVLLLAVMCAAVVAVAYDLIVNH